MGRDVCGMDDARGARAPIIVYSGAAFRSSVNGTLNPSIAGRAGCCRSLLAALLHYGREPPPAVLPSSLHTHFSLRCFLVPLSDADCSGCDEPALGTVEYLLVEDIWIRIGRSATM
jgi:hypothetical protein